MNKSVSFLLITQAATAFADRAIFFILFVVIGNFAGLASWYTPLLQLSFILAYVLFAPWAGSFSDRRPKRNVLITGNIVKLTGLGLLFFHLIPELTEWAILIGYFVIGIGAVMFSPAKYGLLPELVDKEKLVKINAWLEGSTIVAILSGQFVGAMLGEINVTMALLIAVAIYPIFRKLKSSMGDRNKLASIVYTLFALALLITPTIMISNSVIDTSAIISEKYESGSLEIPPPDESVKQWPLIGEKTHAFWLQASENLEATLIKYETQTKEVGKAIIAGAAGAAGTILQFVLSIIISGILLLTGALIIEHQTGTLEFNKIGLTDFGIAGWLIFIAIGIKCAFPFFHNWLTDSYAEATPTGSVFLSAFTTKVAIYALARGFAGTEILIYIGAAMTCFPIFYAVIENDLRRVLAYSMINQIGFMVTGIGIGTALAINGAVSHAFNDVIFKGLLFMSMGAVLHMTGRINGSDLGGLYKSMPKTTILCIIGAASISAFPLFSGFVSKSMVMSAAQEGNYDIVWLMLLFASAGVFHHAGIKIPFFAFFAHDSGIRTSEPPFNMLFAMSISAALCITIGIYPSFLYQLLPFDTGYNPYTATHVLAQTQLLFFSALAFVWLNLKGLYPPELHSINIDAEWIYRRFSPRILQSTFALIWKVDNSIRKQFMYYCKQFTQLLFNYNNPTGSFSQSKLTGSMVIWVVVLLLMYLIFSFTK